MIIQQKTYLEYDLIFYRAKLRPEATPTSLSPHETDSAELTKPHLK